MSRTSFETMNCPVAQSLNLVGEWWSILILRNAFCGMTRFQDFHQHLGIASGTLTTRLQRLTENGIFERVRCQVDGRSYEYKLTEKGLELSPMLLALSEWGEKWAPNPKGRRIRFVERSTGLDIAGVSAISADGTRPLGLAELDVLPGSGADGKTDALLHGKVAAPTLDKEISFFN
jgi:DNA-binding HxlR family transcriptional regulator